MTILGSRDPYLKVQEKVLGLRFHYDNVRRQWWLWSKDLQYTQAKQAASLADAEEQAIIDIETMGEPVVPAAKT